MVFVTKPLAVTLASLAVASVLWNVYSRVSFFGGGLCQFVLTGAHGNYWHLKEEMDRLDSDLAKLKKHKKELDLKKKSAGKKSADEKANEDIPAKFARLEKANEELRNVIKNIPNTMTALKGGAEDTRAAAEFLHNETTELREKLKKLKSRLSNILKSIKSR